MDVYVTFRWDGRIKGVHSVGRPVSEIIKETEPPYYERWTIDMPQLGPTRMWLRDGDRNPVTGER